MNVASVGITPSSTTDTATAPGTGELADLFATLVSTLLDGQGGEDAAPEDEQASPVPDPETVTADAAAAASLAFLVGVVPVQAPVVLATQAQVTNQALGDPQDVSVAGTQASSATATGLGAAAEQSVNAVPNGTVPDVAAGEGATENPTGQAPAANQAPVSQNTPDGATGAAPADADKSSDDAAAPTTPTIIAAPAPATVATGGATSAATAPAPAPEPTAMVTTQVFDAISKLVARPDGSHRVTLKLNPAELGEVEIIMTTRNGSVRVELHGSDEATAALRSGTHELFRLLEATPGTTSTHISVRDTTGSSATSYQGTDQGRSGDAQRQATAQDQENLSAGKRTGSKDPATDGPFAPRAVSSSGRIDQDGTSLTNGFDVTV